MALQKMQRIYIYALKKDKDRILELLQRRGIIEVRNMLKEDKIFRREDIGHAKESSEKNVAAVSQALEILNSYVKENKSLLSSLKGRKELPEEVYASFGEKLESVVEIAKRIITLSKKIAEEKAELIRLQNQIEILKPWVNLDIPLNFKGTKHTAGFIGTLPKEWTLEEIYEKLAAYMPLDVEIISATKEQTCIFVLCTNTFKDNVFETLRAMDFILPSISLDKAPAEQLKDFEKQAEEIKGRINTYLEEMKSYDKSREDLYFLLDYETIRIEKYDVIGNLLQSKNVFIITGFIPEKDAKHIEEELTSKFDLAVEVTEPKNKDQVPVLYKNNGFCEPLEGIVNSFSPPGKGEIDPTMVMSLFYYMLFGLMLSDAGYGFLMAVGCAFALYKFRNTMERPMKNTLKMYLYCGISTIFWGIMFGSYFGDIFDVVGTTFFGVEKVPVIPPLWFFPVEKPMLMLTFCMAVGILHLLIGLAMKGYQAIKHKDYKSLVYDAVFWITLLISCVLLLLSMEMIKNILGINIELPAYAVKAAGILAIISAAGIILTNGRESKNPFKRILKGLYALYGISGYLSDVLSYSRLLALGLATGVIGSVINKMAAMTAGGIFGPVIFTVIVIIGHALNIGINALGAYVHTNRLQYVEFFGKFYEGGGTLFKPFGMHTKYYKIKE
ncbi:V/A-type H+-transporting ATPase subunit I [Herbinix hemicellulosilytica]|uniref:Uncharacterized protein n=1 Tax=Herbinix hemicellulosilytica TaxID=1564487 RepID=A0A0H5SFC6_HERHM|nr:V-type ATP synthase subunit I [Herbinix hemicellulosilytica]RBP56809.1 V/A-type H+-transporting ATPase subunit I [Herbinix hemicellulosilytica]CRZ34192.1 hypothetical protein HHT355_0989 [Herbinix hemicellulosilytica]